MTPPLSQTNSSSGSGSGRGSGSSSGSGSGGSGNSQDKSVIDGQSVSGKGETGTLKGKGSTHSVTVDRAEMKRGGGGIPTQTGDVVADREARERERARIAAMDRERETERKRNSDNMRERERERDRGLDIPWNPTIRSGHITLILFQY